MSLPSPRRLLGVSLVVAVLGIVAATLSARAPERLVTRSRAVEAPGKTHSVGDKVATGPGQRSRLLLPDRSVVYLQEHSSLTVTAADRITLTAGEAFIETVPGKLAPALVVVTPKREVRARDSRFGVRIGEEGTTVLVASGKAHVEGIEEPILAGQTLEATAKKPAAAPRISHLVAWTRDLREAAPLVPPSQHSGGTLIARDPDGQEAKLELRRYRIDVHIEDGFARTTIDQTYFNQTQDRLEGTFRFPLPPDASLSRLAMYVDGKLMEGGMAERDHARAVYERIVWEKRDPALLEWVDGSTFKMRVFPLEARQEKRLLLSYTQRLPVLYGTLGYRFPAGHSFAQVGEWSLHVRVKAGAEMTWSSGSHTLKARKEAGDLILDASQKLARLDRDVVLNLTEPAGKAGEQVRFSTAELDGQKYLMVRYRPALEGAVNPERRDWVILVETSADRDPLLARTQIELVRSLLAHAGREDTFTLVTAATRTRKLQAKPALNDTAAGEEAIAELEKAHLVGAFDLGKALTEVRPLLEAAKTPYLLHIGSGIAAMGENRSGELLKRIPKGTRYVGVGVGKRWNRSFMQSAAEQTGGYFTQVNPDEPIAWRGMDLAMTLNTPRLLDVTVSDQTGKAAFLPFVRMLSQGEEIAAVAQVKGELPETVRIAGRLDGREVVRDVAVKDVQENAGHLPRSWAKLRIEQLLAEDAVKHKNAIVELSKAMYVMTPFTSLLVLENEDMYKQFAVDRGRKDHWAMYPAPAKIPVVFEPIEGDAGDAKKGIRPSAKVVAQTVLTRAGSRVLNVPESMAPASRVRHVNISGFVQGVPGSGLENLGDLTHYSRVPEILAYQPPDPARAAMSMEDFLSRRHPDGEDRSTDRSTINSWSEAKPARPAENSPDLTNTDLGLDTGKPLAYNVDRIDGISVPGGATDDAPVALAGIAFSPDGLRTLVATQSRTRAGGSGPVRVWYQVTRGQSHSLLFARPGYTGDDRLFYDLLAYAPGLNTSAADLRAVVETEARVNPRLRRGTVTAGVRALFAKARAAGWRSLEVPAGARTPAYRIHFDGAGRFAWERTLSSGLRERVICDGKTLWHLYPELGLAARRTVSRFHRLALAQALPWVLPLPEDLAHGADLDLRDGENSIVIAPHAVKEDGEGKGKARQRSGMQLVLVFADGRLAERRWVSLEKKEIPRRETYSADGTVKVFDKDDKEVFVHKAAIEESREPSLTAEVKKLVVLDLPFRTPAQVKAALKIEKKQLAELTFDEARQLLTAFVAAGDAGQSRQVFEQALARRDERPLGYYVLLAAAGVNLDGDNLDVLDAHPHEPLAHYLALHSSPVLRKHASRWAAASNTFSEGMLRRLALGHALCQRWASGKSLGTSAAQRKGERQRALAYVKQYKGTALAWALLGLVQDRTAEEKDKESSQAGYRDLAASYELFSDVPGLGSLARYEQARCQWKAGQKADAQLRFLDLYAEAGKNGGLLAIDADFREALLSAEDGWSDLMRRTAARLVKEKKRSAVLLLARQAWQLDDAAMAQHLFGVAMKDVPVKGKESQALQRAALAFLMGTAQTAAADRLVQRLLENGENAKNASLWRVAAKLAGDREMPARQLECLEKALELEFANLPEVLNLSRVREDYGSLLGQYESLTKALATLKMPAPDGFRDKVVRAADRWRALDRDQEKAATAAATVLRGLGERELAWDYLTTPVALRPGEAEVWISLADRLKRQGERDLADRAYQAAFEREATNAQVLWDRADNLRQVGRLAQAQTLYRQLADGEWQPRFATLKTQAKWVLEGK